MKISEKKYYIITIGCQMNKSDSERIAAYLDDLGYSEAVIRSQADLVVITTCGVRQSAEDRIYGLIAQIEKDNKNAKIILTGCLSERADVRERLGDRVDIWLPICDLPDLAEKLGADKFSPYKNYLSVQPKYASAFSAFVPIGNGCDNFCAYCVVPYARGREVYRPTEEILEEVKKLVAGGYKEITLIAQNVNSYKNADAANNMRMPRISDKEINFSELLRLVNNIPGNFWLRFSTSHPKDMSDELIQAITECEKVCELVHLPAQAGDDNVLRAMNRKYTIEHYKKLIEKIKIISDLRIKNFNLRKDFWPLPMAISTDIIVGFPGETREQFENTAELFREVKFDMAYIAQYSPRYGTAAAKLKDDVNPEEKKQREMELDKILRITAKENNQQYLDKIVEVLVENKTKKGEWIGRTRTNKVVKIKGLKDLKIEKLKDPKIGGFVRAQINHVEAFGMDGELIE